jgi:hypothetical protein
LQVQEQKVLVLDYPHKSTLFEGFDEDGGKLGSFWEVKHGLAVGRTVLALGMG